MPRKNSNVLIVVAVVVVAALVSVLAYSEYFSGPLFYSSNSVPIESDSDRSKVASFDILVATVDRQGADIVFAQQVYGGAGDVIPNATGSLGGAEVYSYVWPTSLDSSVAGFEAGQGILALAATSHPDFDDTPLYDENVDGDNANDGAEWHAHWVVLVESSDCGEGALKVRDIPNGATPSLPSTWPGLPILIDSPDYYVEAGANLVTVAFPADEIGAPEDFSFDGVTAALRVNADIHSPLLCVEDVFDVASGNLTLPGKYVS